MFRWTRPRCATDRRHPRRHTHPDDAVAQLRRLPFADLGDAFVDHHRALRQGIPEAVYGRGKTPTSACDRRRAAHARLGPGAVHPGRRRATQRRARRITGPASRRPAPCCGAGHRPVAPADVLVVSAGTATSRRRRVRADPVRIRLRARPAHRRRRRRHPPPARPPRPLTAADAVVVVAGMEGALASVIGGITARRSSPCRPASATAPRSRRHRAAGDALLVRQRGHRGRHRQRLRRGVRGRQDRCRSDPHRLVPLLRRHGRRHDARRARACGRRPAGGRRDRRAARPRRLRADVRGRAALRDRRHPAHVVVHDDDHDQHDHDHGTTTHHHRRVPRHPDAARRRGSARRVCATAPSARSACSPTSRARCTGWTPTTSSSTRSARSTRSSTSSARARRSRCSASSASCAARSPSARARCSRARRAAQPGSGRRRAARPPQRAEPWHRRPQELATPTGVALMVALADEFGPMPAMNVTSVGYGAGTRDIDGRPNVVQVVIGDAAATSRDARTRSARRAARVQRRRRDRRGHRAHDRRAARRRRARRVGDADRDEEGPAGAHRARAVRPAAAPLRRRVAARETGSLGVRGTSLTRWPQQRSERTGRSSTATRSASRSAAAGRRSSTTTPPRPRSARVARCATSSPQAHGAADAGRGQRSPPFVDADFVAAIPRPCSPTSAGTSTAATAAPRSRPAHLPGARLGRPRDTTSPRTTARRRGPPPVPDAADFAQRWRARHRRRLDRRRLRRQRRGHGRAPRHDAADARPRRRAARRRAAAWTGPLETGPGAAAAPRDVHRRPSGRRSDSPPPTRPPPPPPAASSSTPARRALPRRGRRRSTSGPATSPAHAAHRGRRARRRRTAAVSRRRAARALRGARRRRRRTRSSRTAAPASARA